ncbi:MAG: M56 family peptidase [wastewater metagenome]|nr:M56 family peptidase [Candidatus Loosdrechtia aerotolerans]
MKFSFSINQQRKAQIFFIAVLLVNIFVSSVTVTGIILGVGGYIAHTQFIYKTVTCCGYICSKCFFTLSTFYTLFPWTCIVIFFAGVCTAVYKVYSMLLLNYRFVRSLKSLPAESHTKLQKIIPRVYPHNRVVLLDTPRFMYAFTSGLWKPKTYVSTAICSYLTSGELFAVILHETHHARSRDPLKLFLVQIFRSLNFFLPINSHLMKLYYSASEKAADDTAISTSGEALDLASALVKLSQSNTPDKHSFPVAFSQGQNIVEDRLRRILVPDTAPPYLRNIYFYLSSLLSFFIAAAVCLPLFYKPFTHTGMIECRAKMCHVTLCGDRDHVSIR